MRIGHFKGVKSQLKKDKQAPWELFDLAKDPAERNEISKEHANLLKQMDEIVKKEHRPSHIKEWEFIDPKF